jgi:hypothetical protein
MNAQPINWVIDWMQQDPDGLNSLFGIGAWHDIQNGPLEITLDKPVNDFAMQVQFIQLPGHYMEAFDAAGVRVDSISFGPGSGPWLATEARLSAPGIRKVVVYPLIGPPDGNGDRHVLDEVAYRAAFVQDTTCPPTGDPALDDPTVRGWLTMEWDIAVTNQKERGGWIFRDDSTGGYFALHDNRMDGTATKCTLDFFDPPVMQGSTVVGNYHTHFIPAGTFMACTRRPPDARAAYGPSFADMRTASRTWTGGQTYDMYIIDAFEVQRLRGGTITPTNTWPWHQGNHCR